MFSGGLLFNNNCFFSVIGEKFCNLFVGIVYVLSGCNVVL